MYITYLHPSTQGGPATPGPGSQTSVATSHSGTSPGTRFRLVAKSDRLLASLTPQAPVLGAQPQNPVLQKIATLQGHLHGVWALAFSPDGQILVSGGKDGTARFWSGVPKADESVLPEVRGALRFSDDENSLLTLNNDLKISELDIRSRQRLRTIDLSLSTN
ncbi:MAG: hypothetical protein EXS36_10340 [Pedosphaera sp.]|nr:hypothetical protein [Pedosphaera sp.]